MQARNLVCLLTVVGLLLSTTACTTTKTFDKPAAAALEQSLRKGDKLHIVETDGTEYELTVETVSAAVLIGERAYLGRVEIPIKRIRHAELTRIAPVRTAGAVVGGTVLVAVAGAVVIAAAMGGAFTPTY